MSDTPSDTPPGLRLAIDRAKSQARLAEIIGCTQQAIAWRVKNRKEISADDALKVEAALGADVVTRQELRPDAFGAAPNRAAA